jgi:hypothetical protein
MREGICSVEAKGHIEAKGLPYHLERYQRTTPDGHGGRLAGKWMRRGSVEIDAALQRRLSAENADVVLILEDGHRWKCVIDAGGRLLNRDNPPKI